MGKHRRRKDMPTYITLYKYTQQGAANIKASPERLSQAIAAGQQAGGKVIGVWATMGQYDLVAVAEFPSDEAMATFNLALASQGNVSSETMKAFTPEEFAKIVAGVPS
jgi:uncharacterized protein with GYD domain